MLIAEFDAREGYLRANLASTAQWLTYACGIAHRTAVEHVRVARALAAHSRLAVEMGAGRLSYSHVRAISRVAQAGDDLIDSLVDAARYGTVAQLESLVRGLRTVEDNEAASDATDREYLKHRWTSQSAWQLTARLDPERGALVTSAIEALARVEDVALPEALVRLAEIGLAVLAPTACGRRGHCVARSARRSSSVSTFRSSRQRHRRVHVNAAGRSPGSRKAAPGYRITWRSGSCVQAGFAPCCTTGRTCSTWGARTGW